MFWGQNLATVGILALRARQTGFPASSPWWCGLQLQWPLQASNGCGSLVCYLSKGCEERLFYFFCWKTSAWASKVTIYSKKNAWCTKDPFEGHSPFWAFGRNFDRSTVKGVVAKLFHIKPDFVGTTVLLWGRKIGQCVVGKDTLIILFFVPCWMPLAALFLPRPTTTVPWRFARAGDSSLWSSTTKRRAKRCWRGANWGWEIPRFWDGRMVLQCRKQKDTKLDFGLWMDLTCCEKPMKTPFEKSKIQTLLCQFPSFSIVCSQPTFGLQAPSHHYSVDQDPGPAGPSISHETFRVLILCCPQRVLEYSWRQFVLIGIMYVYLSDMISV